MYISSDVEMHAHHRKFQKYRKIKNKNNLNSTTPTLFLYVYIYTWKVINTLYIEQYTILLC